MTTVASACLADLRFAVWVGAWRAAQLGAQVLTGKAATETAVRARMSTAPLIHCATHGLAYGTASAERRSFVAFAPESAQDGLLTMGELMDEPLLTLQAELVVLSAKFYAFWLDPTKVRSKATALQMAQDAVRRTPGYANPTY